MYVKTAGHKEEKTLISDLLEEVDITLREQLEVTTNYKTHQQLINKINQVRDSWFEKHAPNRHVVFRMISNYQNKYVQPSYSPTLAGLIEAFQ